MRSTSKADSRASPAVIPVQRGGGQALPQQRLDEEGRSARLEPVVPEPPLVEQQQDVERVVDLPLPEPAVAVVPTLHFVPVEVPQFRGEYGVEVRVRITADRAVTLIKGDVVQVVQTGEEPGLRELAHTRQETEPDVLVAVLDHPVEAPQEVPVRPCDLRFLKRVQDRLVVLVDQHHHLFLRDPVEALDQVCEALRRLPVQPCDPRIPFHFAQLRVEARVKVSGRGERASAEADPNHRMFDGPVPLAMDRQAAEQLRVALEQLLERVHQKALPETPRARQEIVFTLPRQTQHMGGLVHVVAAHPPDFPKRLDADGERAPFHPRKLGPRAFGVKRAPRPRRGSDPAGRICGRGMGIPQASPGRMVRPPARRCCRCRRRVRVRSPGGGGPNRRHRIRAAVGETDGPDIPPVRPPRPRRRRCCAPPG